ncbi:MAG: isoprenyl transferase [Proteobacteria bacterium]|nr:MAG: isoprenyl transferase [Pseudomonadota bacterium]
MKAVPNHVAIIMDGNGRWAQARGNPRAYGHIRGVSRIKPVVLEANRLGIKAVTLYAFSTENWKRPSAELSVLWKLLIKFLRRELEQLDRENVQLAVVGEKDRLPPEVLSELDPAIVRLSKNTGLRLNFAVSYGGRLDLLQAARAFAVQVQAGTKQPQDLDEAEFEKNLSTAHLGEYSDVDLLIRTSGEFRISNFLLWQAAYAEFVFLDKNWPDFEAADLLAAVQSYQSRDRRYGGLTKP